MRTVVTGASGFLGSWTVRALISAGHSVTALVRQPDPWRLAHVDGVVVVASPAREWPAVIERARPDVLVALDWNGVAGPSRNDDRQWSNLPRQRELLLAAIQAGATRIVAAGSQAEYGPRSDRVTESAPPAPESVYAKVKVAAMTQLMELCGGSGISAVWARVFSVYGPMDNDGVLLQVTADSLRTLGTVDLTSGEQLWSYLYASDAGTAMATLAGALGAEGVYNVGHPDAPRLRDTIERFAQLGGWRDGLHFGALAGGAQRITRLEPDVERLRSLGWAPAVTLETGLDRTAAWLAGGSLADPFETGRLLPRRPS